MTLPRGTMWWLYLRPPKAHMTMRPSVDTPTGNSHSGKEKTILVIQMKSCAAATTLCSMVTITILLTTPTFPV